MTAMKLKDKVAIVTGAASGIGRSVAQVFAAKDATWLWSISTRLD